ncbi:MAG: transketolase C-terminal domain-containing protein, partial [candidate division NC10 bacterium]|nr:transketolase C-terminal domain-containing protein [candidate division NC10 bacterium]
LPVVAVYSTFLQRAYDQTLHDICLQNLQVVFAVDRAGIVGEDGPTHSGIYDLSFLRHLPHLVIMAPKDENELRHMLKTAVCHPGPVALRYPRGRGLGVAWDPQLKRLEIGKGEVLREGKDLLLLGLGSMVSPCLEAAKRLEEEEGIRATVINARFLKPLDLTLIGGAVRETGKVLIVEENVLPGGFGSAVLEGLVDARIDLDGLRIERIGIPDAIICQGTMEGVRAKYGLCSDSIAARGKEMMKEPIPLPARRRSRRSGRD